jgi:V/A-type H+-transporting ATPase subunit K
MYWLVGLLSLALFATIAVGILIETRALPIRVGAPRLFKRTLAGNLVIFVVAMVGVVFLGIQDVLAQSVATTGGEISEGLGLALIGIGIPTGLAAIGAGIAVGPVGAASLAIISEKPEMFGRTLIYLGLAEGIAIYGLVVTILLLGKIG